MKHILISFLLITIAFSSLRGSERKNKHHDKNSRSYSESSTESYDYSNQSSDDQYYSKESISEYSSYSLSEDSDSELSYSSSSSDDSDSSEDEQKSHRPRPDEFTRSVFKTLKQIEKGILQDWRLTEDPVLKNQIRILLIQNLENLLPIAQTPVEPIEIQSVSSRIHEENNENHQRPPHPRPPQPPHPEPEDEFANQVFDTLHQIAQVILEQWNVEKDVEVKNQLRQNILEQLGALLPQNE
ncbi:unnamed protein product [Paramecium primaurelia]|uniref:Uncharacterized protein n=1 Tax=Paramecium primaurelia TaxID=5886 RepID=A0A8S1M923_PARPR|nr:unnamed protein product [Paramecium primaurelia]